MFALNTDDGLADRPQRANLSVRAGALQSLPTDHQTGPGTRVRGPSACPRGNIRWRTLGGRRRRRQPRDDQHT